MNTKNVAETKPDIQRRRVLAPCLIFSLLSFFGHCPTASAALKCEGLFGAKQSLNKKIEALLEMKFFKRENGYSFGLSFKTQGLQQLRKQS